MAENLVFFKKNVSYAVAVRYYVKDPLGKTLTDNDPWVAVEESNLRDFMRANKWTIEHGLIVKAEEPPFEFDTPNMIDDEQAKELVKNYFALKKALPEITSDSIVIKLLETAKEENRPHKTIGLIQARLDEFAEESPWAMRGITNE